jgi:hypothetical protein
MGGACSVNEKWNACMLLAGKPEGMRPQGRPSCRWVDYIRMDLREREVVVVRPGLIWLRIGSSRGLL